MPDFRVYAPDATAEAAEIRLGAEESHHLVTVNRCGRGDSVTAFDGRGHEWLTECIDPSKSAVVLRVKESCPAKLRSHEITLAQALPKGSVMDDIVRQATEIGVTRIVPLQSERTQVHLDGDRAEKKIEKWRTAAIEAAKQCGNPWLPEITPGQSLVTVIPLKKALASHVHRHGAAPRSVLWLVGPEGDFSAGEVTTALTAGFQPITLGPLVLRSDTAAVYALSILSYELANV